MGTPVIIAGDVGGTKTYLAAFDPAAQGFAPLVERRYQTASYPSAGALLKIFADETQIDPSRTVLGVPGPVHQLPVRAVNLPYLIDPSEISAVLNGTDVHLLNDLQATSYGTLVLEPDDLCPLNQGQRDPKGNIAVIAAGTGLGEGGLCWAENRYAAIASEGGHATFGPSSSLEVELWRFLNERYGHVSWERVVSGQGLAAIYDFLCERQRITVSRISNTVLPWRPGRHPGSSVTVPRIRCSRSRRWRSTRLDTSRQTASAVSCGSAAPSTTMAPCAISVREWSS